MNDFSNHPPAYVLVITAVLLICQSTWIFHDAQKRSARPWAWGLWALTTMPMPLILYLLVVRRRDRRKRPSG